jgi:hypothetical protein
MPVARKREIITDARAGMTISKRHARRTAGPFAFRREKDEEAAGRAGVAGECRSGGDEPRRRAGAGHAAPVAVHFQDAAPRCSRTRRDAGDQVAPQRAGSPAGSVHIMCGVCVVRRVRGAGRLSRRVLPRPTEELADLPVGAPVLPAVLHDLRSSAALSVLPRRLSRVRSAAVRAVVLHRPLRRLRAAVALIAASISPIDPLAPWT